MKYKVTQRGIEKAGDNETGVNVFATWNEAKAYRHQNDTPAQPMTDEQKHAQWFAIHSVPSAKSLENLDTKLAAIKAAEKIENGSEEL